MGFNPRLPTKYTGTNKYITFFVSRSRRPTLSDYKQPETGNLYSIGTIWQVGKEPTDGVEGEMWILTKIVANQGVWKLLLGEGSAFDTITPDSGSVVVPDSNGDVNVTGRQDANFSNSSFSTSGLLNTLTLNTTDSLGNTILGNDTTGARTITTGSGNTGLGSFTLSNLTTGSTNTALSANAGQNITSGSFNLYAGVNSGSSNTGSDSSNIYLSNIGILGESNTTRVGTTGSSSGQQSRCFVAGVEGVNVGSVATVVSMSSGQLGTTVLTAGTGISITPGANSITISTSGGGGAGTQVRSYVPSGSSITLTTATPANITSISLTAGTWDISTLVGFTNPVVSGVTIVQSSISTTSATLSTNLGDDTIKYIIGGGGSASEEPFLTIAQFRVTPAVTTTYYLVTQASFSKSIAPPGELYAYGRISAVQIS